MMMETRKEFALIKNKTFPLSILRCFSHLFAAFKSVQIITNAKILFWDVNLQKWKKQASFNGFFVAQEVNEWQKITSDNS